MQNDDDIKKKIIDDPATNAEYVNQEELDTIEGKDGEALDPIEQDQITPDEEEADAKKQLREIIEGDDNDRDALLDE
jgi:hypothetical protein